MNQQVKAGLSALRDFLAGRSGEANVAATEDKATREVVAAELLATLSGRSPADAAHVETSSTDTQEIPRFDYGAQPYEAKQEEKHREHLDQSEQPRHEGSNEHERERARELFLDHGYFDEVVQNLRAGGSAEQRAAAARVLGLVGSQRGTAHLIAAMFDDDPEVRRAAEEALNLIGDPNVTNAPVAASSKSEVVGINEVEISKPVVSEESAPDSTAASEQVGIGSAQAEMTDEGGRDARGPSQVVEGTSLAVSDGAAEYPVMKNVVLPATPDLPATQELTVTPDLSIASALVPTDSRAAGEEERLLLEENKVRETVAQIQQQLLETISLRRESEHEVEQRTEHEVRLRVEAAARRREEEELRRRAEDEAERRRAEDREAVAAEQEARAQAEAEVQHLAEEETNLRLKTADLKRTAEEFARQRSDREAARLEAAEVAQRMAATRARDEAKARHDAELDRLRREAETLRARTAEIVERHAEVEAAREKADAEAERLLEAQARMRDAEEARAQAEIERVQVESEIRQKVETALRQLEDTRRRGQEEQERLEEEARRRAEAEQHRRAELAEMKTKAEANSRQLAETEQQILAQVNSLRIADAETRKRIADAEVRRHAAEAAYRLVAEQVQRVEAEAHARAQEEEQVQARLEAERRTVAVEAQLRADQGKRVREEIEMFHRLEEQERPRIEEAILQRAEAEARLQQQRQRFKTDEETRVCAGEDLDAGHIRSAPIWECPPSGKDQLGATADRDAGEVSSDVHGDVHGGAAPAPVAPAISAFLSSVDPYKRVAAVAELARSRPEDAFALITSCFDDHSPHVRNAAARALRKLDPPRTVDLFNRALEEASPERRRHIGSAIAASGVATEAIENLVSENREDTFSALSILFVMAKTGEVEPLTRALAEHPDDEIGKAVAKLLALSGHR